MARQTKALGAEHAQLKVDVDSRIVEGYASVFGNVDSYGDIVDAGAFSRTLAEKGQELPYLWSHRADELPLGKTIELREDDYGLYYRAQISATTRGDDFLVAVQDGTVKGASFAFDISPGGAERKGGVRHLTELVLWEVSAAVWGANDKATTEPGKALVTFDAAFAEGRAEIEAKAQLMDVADALYLLGRARELVQDALNMANRQPSEWDDGPEASQETVDALWAEFRALREDINSYQEGE